MERKAKHTPGPWKIEPSTTNDGDLVFTIKTVDDIKDEVFVAETCGGVPSLEGEANALLCAAAPELLEALHSVMDEYKAGMSMPDGLANKVILAIAKAEGK